MMVSVDALSRLRAQTNPSTPDGDESGLPSTPSPPQNPSVRPLASPEDTHEFGSIGKESDLIALALRRLSLENQTDKAAQLVVPLADAAFDPQKLNNERTFNGCVSSVQGEGCLKVLRSEGFVPCFVNVLRGGDQIILILLIHSSISFARHGDQSAQSD